MLPHHHDIKCSNDACRETGFPSITNNLSHNNMNSLLRELRRSYDTLHLHCLSNMRLVAIAELPQDSQSYVATNPDTLLDYHIYAEYYPYIAVDADIQYKPHEMPEPVQSVFADIVSRIDIDSPYNQDSDYYLDI